jgi:hypothetical protein
MSRSKDMTNAQICKVYKTAKNSILTLKTFKKLF